MAAASSHTCASGPQQGPALCQLAQSVLGLRWANPNKPLRNQGSRQSYETVCSH
jgi:hypothetical protein